MSNGMRKDTNTKDTGTNKRVGYGYGDDRRGDKDHSYSSYQSVARERTTGDNGYSRKRTRDEGFQNSRRQPPRNGPGPRRNEGGSYKSADYYQSDPYSSGPDPYQSGQDPYSSGQDPYSAGPYSSEDPYSSGQDPYYLSDPYSSRQSKYPSGPGKYPSGPGFSSGYSSRQNGYSQRNAYPQRDGYQRDSYKPYPRDNYSNSYTPRERYPRNNRRNDDYKRRNDHEEYNPAPVKEKETIKNPDLVIKTGEEKLKQLSDIPFLEDIPVSDSKWGVKPKGFEKVSSQRAKLSGLFPLPGYPRPIDYTKLEGSVQDGTSEGGLLLVDSQIDPNDSKIARTLIIEGIDFHTIDYLKVAEFIGNKLNNIDLPSLADHNIESKYKTKDNKSLIIEFRSNETATICKELSGLPITIDGNDCVLNFRRPRGYIAQGYIKDASNTEDNAYKVTFIIGTEFEESAVVSQISSIAEVESHQFLKDKISKESLGILFVNFKLPSFEPSDAIKFVEDVMNKVKSGFSDVVKSSHFSCISPGETSIQLKPLDENTLLEYVKNQDIAVAVSSGAGIEVTSTTKKLTVIQILNAVTTKDLADDANYNFIRQDIEEEVKKFGEVVQVKIPRSTSELLVGLEHLAEFDLNRIFVEFADEESAFKAIMGLAGRNYNDRTVLCSFYNADDFKNNIL